jgi:hypothetical protein
MDWLVEEYRTLYEGNLRPIGVAKRRTSYMQRQAVRLTRQELYEKMWSRPAISLAEEFGISGAAVFESFRSGNSSPIH